MTGNDNTKLLTIFILFSELTEIKGILKIYITHLCCLDICPKPYGRETKNNLITLSPERKLPFLTFSPAAYTFTSHCRINVKNV